MGTDVTTGRQFTLAHGTQRVVVAGTGATLLTWKAGDRRLLDAGPVTGAIDRAYRGKVLMPWPNRVGHGRYDFGGAEHELPVDEPDRGHALHGLALWVDWTAVEIRGDAVTLELDLRPRPGYPFALRLRAGYALGADGLAVTFEACNTGDRPAPFGAGLHPYLAAGRDRIDDDELCLPAAARLAVDDRLIPTGERLAVAGTAHDFRAPRRIGDAVLDDCFSDLERDGDGLARVRLSAGGRRLTLWVDEAFAYLQAFTGDTLPAGQRRRSIAVEPMTCAPDAFNSGEGLRVLEPGERFRGRFGLQAELD